MRSIPNKQELQHRVTNQLTSLKLGDMIKWCQTDAKMQHLIDYQQRFHQQTDDAENQEKTLWKTLSGDKAMAEFFSLLGISGKELLRRGQSGDIYAGHVFCQLAEHIMSFSQLVIANRAPGN